MTDLGPDARALLDAARDADEGELHASRERVRGALGRRLGAAAVGLGATTTAATATASVSVVTKIVLGLAALGVVAGGVAVTRPHPQPQTQPSAPVVIAKAPLALPTPEPTVQPAIPAPSASVAAPEPAPIAKPIAPPPAAVASSSFEEQLSALRNANDKLVVGKPAEALAILDASPATGTLAEERAGLRLLARCALAQPGAAATARAFLESHPSSPLAARLKSTCSLD